VKNQASTNIFLLIIIHIEILTGQQGGFYIQKSNGKQYGLLMNSGMACFIMFLVWVVRQTEF